MGKEVLIGRLRQTPERVDDDVREVDVFLNLEVLEAGFLRTRARCAEGEDEEDAAALLATATLLIGGAAMYFSLNGDDFNKPLFYSVLVGAGGLNVLNRMRGQLTKDARRLWVDLVILAPVFTYWVWISFDGNRAT